MSLLCHSASRPPLPASAEMQLGAWNAAMPALKVSFRDALASTLPALDSKKQTDLSSLQLVVPALVRDTSTASTPTGSITPADSDVDDWQSELDAASRCTSPMLWQADLDLSSPSNSSGSWQADDELSSPAHSFASFSCCSDDSEWASELPLPVHFSQPPLDLSTTVEVDYEALEREAQEEAEIASEAECRLQEAASASAVDPFTELSWRNRFRLMAGLVRGPLEYAMGRPRNSARTVLYYAPAGKSGSRIHHLRAAARGLDRSGNRIAASSASKAISSGSIPNPYDALVEPADSKPEVDELEPSQRSNNKDRKQQQARAKVQKQGRSLAAPSRPAMVKASAAFRTVIRDRAARKQQLKQAVSSLRPTLPKHMRPRSRGCGFSRSEAARAQKAAAVAAPPPPTASRVSDCDELSPSSLRQSSFERFRRAFYHKHRSAIEGSLTGSRRVTDVRLAPIGECARSRFMQRLRHLAPHEHDLPLVYHGTKIANMDSICRKGLLVPGRGNGVRVENGSAYGVGVYTCRNADYPTSFSNCLTIFVCAAITTGGSRQGSQECVVAGDVIVLMDEARVVPLFLLDFANNQSSPAAGNFMASSSTNAQQAAPPSIGLDLLRRMLAAAHTKQRKQQAHVSAMFMRVLDAQ